MEWTVTQLLDQTHDSAVRSWVASAGRPETDFPIQNLPLGVFRAAGASGPGSIGVAIGDEIFDLGRAVRAGELGPLGPEITDALSDPVLNRFMALGRPAARQLRRAVHAALRADSPDQQRLTAHLVPMARADLLLPCAIGDYTDFYASIHHATNVGSMFRPEQPLMPNYKWVPVGYHGRASSVVPSGTPLRRPLGQLKDDAAPAPVQAPTRALDYECEVGAWVGAGNPLGEPIPIGDAETHLFGLSLLNDWSARDVQRWEYQPLGPFLAKNFGTTVSPWVITTDALEPFRVPRTPRPEGDPAPLPYLDAEGDRERGGFGIELTVRLSSARMRREALEPLRVSRCNFANMYWTMAQLLTHHASNGCNLRPGDLLGSGTVSGPEKESRGCLLERTWRGTEPLALPDGTPRRFLEDGDEIGLTGRCERAGFASIGFGECRGVVLPAVFPP
jgi:fumarylacetoacetase